MIEAQQDVVVILGVLQALLGLGLGALFAHYQLTYRRPHLALWSAGFFSLALYLLCSLVAPTMSRGQSIVNPRAVFEVLSQVFFYAHLATLVLGTMAVRAGTAPPAYLVRAVIAASVMLGLTASLALALDTTAARQRLILRDGLGEFVAAATYVSVGFVLLLGQRWRHAPVGQRIVAVFFLFLGASALTSFLVLILPTSGILAILAPILSIVEMIAVAAIGTGLVVWLFDTERARAERATGEVERLTYFDPRTGLPNRRLFQDRLVERLINADVHGVRAAVIVARLDRIGSLRAALGATKVDAAIAKLSQRLADVAGTGGVIGRLDDERLIIAMDQVEGPADVELRARQLLPLLSLPISGSGRPDVVITCAIGSAMFPDDSDTAEDLITAAVSAQAGASSAGGNCWVPFNRNIGQRNRERVEIAAELRRALAAEEFEMHFQPMVDRERRIVAAEALLRWRHPRRGLLPPGSFLGVAEHGGLLPDIDRQVLNSVCAVIAARARSRIWVPTAVNVAAQTFEAADFADYLAHTIELHGLAPSMLEIEITEATAMRELSQAARTIEKIRALGVSLSLDDFGVGYSSMSQLRHLAADKLKIDKSFTAGVQFHRKDAAIVSALINLGHSLELKVVAEGIEDSGQLNYYCEHGADLMQGYLLGRPVPEAVFAETLAAQQAVMPEQAT